jgi:hypothetical protein
MKIDCQGEVSTWADPGVIRIGSVKRCKSLHEGMRIDQVDGLNLTSDPKALQRVSKHCADEGSIVLNVQGGEPIKLACTADVVPRLHFYAVAPDRLTSVLPAPVLTQAARTPTDVE